MSEKFREQNIKRIVKELFFISLGCAIYSFALLHFNVPNQLAEGGGTGIALFLLYAFGLPVSMGTLLVNIPLLILGYKMLDKKTMIYTIYGIFMLTFWIKIFETYHVVIDIGGDRLLASVFGGIIAGIGLGIVFVFGGTTGGVDIIAKIINTYLGFSIGRIIQVLDGFILLLSFMVLKSFPVSDDMGRGLTFIKGQGSYSRKDMNIGYCVVSRTEISKLKSLIYGIDPNAFLTITEVHDIMGEGFSFDQPKRIKFTFKKEK